MNNPSALDPLMHKFTEALSSAPENNNETLRALPLSIPRADGILDLTAPFNPYYDAQAHAFFKAVAAAYGLTVSLNEQLWRCIDKDIQNMPHGAMPSR